LGLAAAVFLSIAIFPAQAGPPLITNDPDTPGAGAWEINVAATGAHTGGVWDIDAPDLDINRGVGDRVQLSLHLPWSHRDTGGAELNTTWSDGPETIADLGARMAITPHLNLMGSIGSQVDGPSGERADIVFYLGAQLLY